MRKESTDERQQGADASPLPLHAQFGAQPDGGGLSACRQRGRFEAMSAGHDRRPVHPLAIRAMAELGIDISDHHSKLWVGLVRDRWDWVITVCDAAYERCPVFPGSVQRAHWGLPDPADAGGDEEEKLAVFRKLRDELVDRLNAWCAERDREAGAGHAPETPPDDSSVAATSKTRLTWIL